MNVGWLDGRLIDMKACGMPFMSAGFRYGVNVFDAMRGYSKPTPAGTQYILFQPHQHLTRFLEGCYELGLEPNANEEHLLEAVKTVIRQNKPTGFFGVRIFGFLNSESFDRGNSRTSLLIFLISLELVSQDRPYNLKICSIPKSVDSLLPATVKCTAHYVKSRTAKVKYGYGFDDLIFVNRSGHVLETSKANIFLVKGQFVITPSSEKHELLKGITRRCVMDLYSHHPVLAEYQCVEREVSTEELFEADEIFLTSTSIGVAPVTQLNEKKMFTWPHTNKVRGALFEWYQSKGKGNVLFYQENNRKGVT